MKWLWLLLIAVLPCQAAMTITREWVVPDHLAPGQPVSLAVTFWTDGWFNPPPEWPDFKVENGALLTTALPNQLLSKNEGGTSWSGVRMERLVTAWDAGDLRLPALDVTLYSTGQAPVAVHLDALEKKVTWPQDVQQPDRFLPAASLNMSQKINVYHSSDNDQTLRAGDVIERVVTVNVEGVMPAQIPPLLFAIAGTPTQRLTPVNRLITSGRGDVNGAQRVETLRYLPVAAGTVDLPPVKLRWWDTTHQQWQVAELPASRYQIAASRTAGAEAALKGQSAGTNLTLAWWTAGLLLLVVVLWFFRRALQYSSRFLLYQWRRFWHPVALPGNVPENRSHR
ncbi:TPA: BatD family protein [Kluyvera ascorbata]|nr:BatD family protein [Kluyvera ascorbata]